MQFPRASGVLVHPSSFPSRYGIGDLGTGAYSFIDFLVASKQSLWQILPLGPTGYGDSPYQCFSAFAGNPLLISPDRLVRDGYLSAEAVAHAPQLNPSRVDFGTVIEYKNSLLRAAQAHFRAQGTAEQRAALADFSAAQAAWLDDYALFMALKTHFADQEGGVWNTWPTALAQRDPQALADWSARLADEVAHYKFLQFLFFDQWLALKQYANERGIQIVGDLPIFVAFDSADVWANRHLFYLDEAGNPTVIAGVPPDYFSATGQRWGNPLYRWSQMRANGYAWWLARLTMVLSQVDIVRIDHFRGFAAYWEIPASEPTAVKGRWVRGPGHDFFETLRREMGDLPIIAEDLGVITPDVEALRDDFGFPGMKVLQFAFGSGPENTGLPHTYERNYVVYTGTHDNETTVGWYHNAGESTRDHARLYMARDGYDIAWDMIRLALASVTDLAVLPLQDLMQLGNNARMNYPGRPGGNWQWRYKEEMLSAEISDRLRALTELYGRVPTEAPQVAVEELEIEEP